MSAIDSARSIVDGVSTTDVALWTVGRSHPGALVCFSIVEVELRSGEVGISIDPVALRSAEDGFGSVEVALWPAVDGVSSAEVAP
jgi:hypothetical protein